MYVFFSFIVFVWRIFEVFVLICFILLVYILGLLEVITLLFLSGIFLRTILSSLYLFIRIGKFVEIARRLLILKFLFFDGLIVRFV